MKLTENGTCWYLPDGRTVAVAGFQSRIEHVTIEGGRFIGSTGLPRDVEAFVLNILVVPHIRTEAGQLAAATVPDRGNIEFRYNEGIKFKAPVTALMNRYHGLVTAQQLLERYRLVIDPTASFRDLGREQSRSMLPVYMCEKLPFAIEHRPGPIGPIWEMQDDGTSTTDLVVEIQYLLRGDLPNLFFC